MDVTSNVSISTIQSVRDRMREKLNGSLKAVKLQTSLAAKIKTKTLNNSAILKVSLKNNNKALACALTAEKENSRRLGNDNMFLLKEVNTLHFQNALLRQNLSIVNKTLTDINEFMNINLSAAMRISSTVEASDRLSLNDAKSERLSRQSTLSLDENQDFRLTGVALRVPSNLVGQEKCDRHQATVVNEENRLLVTPPSISAVSEDCDKIGELEAHPLNLSPKESLSLCVEVRSRDSLSNRKASDAILSLDEVFSPSNRNAQSGGFVTRRRKKSTLSHSRRLSRNESNQTWGSSGSHRDSYPSTHWEINTDFTILPELGDTDFGAAERSVEQNGRLSTTSHHALVSEILDSAQNSGVNKYVSKVSYEEEPTQSTNPPEVVLSEESDLQTSYVGQEKTMYESDMEMTTSESASIIALPKNKIRASKNKSFLPVKQASTLRKVKAGREKTKITKSSVDKEVNDLSSSSEKGYTKSAENISAGHYDRRTYVLPGPDDERFDSLDADPFRSDCPAVHEALESRTQEFPDNQILDSENTGLTLTQNKEYCTESGSIADIAPKKTKSKNIKEASKTESSGKKKRKMYKKSKNQEQITEENVNDFTDHNDSDPPKNTMPSINVKKLEPELRRETYFVSAPNDHPPTKLNYRRKTVAIPDPSPLVSVILNSSVLIEKNDTLVEPQPQVDHSAPKVPHKIKNPSEPKNVDCEGEQCNPISDSEDLHGHKKRVPKCSGKKSSSGLFSELDKRKTYILPSKQNDLTGKKVPLVRESFMNLRSNPRGKASWFPDLLASNDSFMLDMVSESILDNTMSSSFAEFPSATDPESNISIDISLKCIPAPELPVPEDCTGERSPVSNNICVEDKNDNQKDTSEMNQQCKVENKSMEVCKTANKPFQDLTNKSRDSTKQSCSEEECDDHNRRRRNPVNYKEPHLRTKLRQGDKFTDTDFLNSAIGKGKGKGKGKQAGRQIKKIKPEESGTGDA